MRKIESTQTRLKRSSLRLLRELFLQRVRFLLELLPTVEIGDAVPGCTAARLADEKTIIARHEEAEHAYKRALSLKPKKGLVWMRLALLLQKEKRYEEAGNACSQAIEIV